MKKNMFYTAALLLAGAVMAACSGSEDITGNDTQKPQTPTAEGAVVLRGTLGSKGSSDEVTRAVASNGTGSWVVGDQFAIYYQTANGYATAVATVNSVNDNGSANFTATLNKPKAGESEVTLVYPASVHDGNGGIKDDALAVQTGNGYDRLDIEKVTTTLSVEEQEGEAAKATLNSDVTMEPQVCFFSLNLYRSDDTPLYVKKLEISDGTHNYTINGCESFNRIQFELWPAENADYTFTAKADEIIYTKVDGVTLGNCGFEHVGCVFDKDGNIYSANNTGNEATYSASFSNKTLTAGIGYLNKLMLNSDGTSDNVTPVAMIAYVGEAGSVDASSNLYHGLAIAMGNCNYFNANANTIKPRADGSIGHQEYSAMWCYEPTPGTTAISEDIVPSTPASHAKSRKNGIEMTTYLINHSTPDCNLTAAKCAREYNVERPEGCSEWFLPAVGQWSLLPNALATKQKDATAVAMLSNLSTDEKKSSFYTPLMRNAGCIPFEEQFYWTCTEAGADDVSGTAFVYIPSRYQFGRRYRYMSFPVRPFIAF